MKRYSLLIVMMLGFFFTPNLFAQDIKGDRDRRPDKLNRDCTPFFKLDLSEEQRNAMKKKGLLFGATMRVLRFRMMEKRLEFKRMLRDPSALEEDCIKKGREIEAVKVEMERTVIGFSIELRRLLTPEQIEKWCPPIERHGGRDKRPQKRDMVGRP